VSGSPNRRTALLVDQHPLWLDTVEHVIARADVDVVAKVTSTATAVDLLARTHLDLLVTGIKMPATELDGIELVRRARELAPGIKTIVLSMYEDGEHIDAAFEAGADAYVLKTAHPDDLTSAVRQAFTHSIFLAGGRPAAAKAAAPVNAPGLTRRELEILQLVAEGHSNAQVARMLWVTEQTVKFHLSNIYRKLGVSNRTEASRWAQLHGLLGAPALAA
jgi:DNA-binding NarL/FixJ family response regulator